MHLQKKIILKGEKTASTHYGPQYLQMSNTRILVLSAIKMFTKAAHKPKAEQGSLHYLS